MGSGERLAPSRVVCRHGRFGWCWFGAAICLLGPGLFGRDSPKFRGRVGDFVPKCLSTRNVGGVLDLSVRAGF